MTISSQQDAATPPTSESHAPPGIGRTPDRQLIRWGGVAGLAGVISLLGSLVVVVALGLPDASDVETLTDFANLESGRIAEHALYLGALVLFALHILVLHRMLRTAHEAAALFGAAVAEFGRGRSDPGADLLFVKIDERISAAVVAGGEIHRATRRGGDLTHIQVQDAAGLCACGMTGCLGIVASVEAVLGPDFVDLSSDARKGLAAETTPEVDNAARALGEVLASAVAALDVERVVLGGAVSQFGAVPNLVAASMERKLGWRPDVVGSDLGDSAAVLGAGGMVLSGELGVVWA